MSASGHEPPVESLPRERQLWDAKRKSDHNFR